MQSQVQKKKKKRGENHHIEINDIDAGVFGAVDVIVVFVMMNVWRYREDKKGGIVTWQR